MEQPVSPERTSKLTPFERGFNIVTITLMVVATLFVAVPRVLVLLDSPPWHRCVAADPVRVTMAGTAYQIPALLRPTLIPAEGAEKMRVETYYPSGGRIMNRYCQAADVPSMQVTHVILGRLGIEDFAAQDRDRYGRLIGTDQSSTIAPISVYARTLYVRPPRNSLAETALAGGAFRQTQISETVYELKSAKPSLFGLSIEGTCSRQPSIHLCKMYGTTAEGLRISFTISPDQRPIETWPEIIPQIEGLLHSLRTN